MDKSNGYFYSQYLQCYLTFSGCITISRAEITILINDDVRNENGGLGLFSAIRCLLISIVAARQRNRIQKDALKTNPVVT